MQTAIRERELKGVEIKITKDEQNQYKVSCPNQTVESQKTKKRFKSEFNIDICTNCSLLSKCRLIRQKNTRVYYFTDEEYLKKRRLETIEKLPKERRSLRTNIEATVSEFTRKMNNRKLKVRGSFKAMLFAFSVGIGVNFGRIYRYIDSQEMQNTLSNA